MSDIDKETEAKLNAIGDEAHRFSDIWKEALESGKLDDEWNATQLLNEGVAQVAEGITVFLQELTQAGYNVENLIERLEAWLISDCDPENLQSIGEDLRTFVLQLGED